MPLRDDLISSVDDARSIISDLGLRRHTVVVRTRVWSGGELGRGTATDTDLTLSPVPKVERVPLRLVTASGGKYQDGDRRVAKISATYTADQLGASTVPAGTEVLWLIDGDPHTLVETPHERNFEWRCVVRRRR